jgi:hypothetical protein
VPGDGEGLGLTGGVAAAVGLAPGLGEEEAVGVLEGVALAGHDSCFTRCEFVSVIAMRPVMGSRATPLL